MIDPGMNADRFCSLMLEAYEELVKQYQAVCNADEPDDDLFQCAYRDIYKWASIGDRLATTSDMKLFIDVILTAVDYMLEEIDDICADYREREAKATKVCCNSLRKDDCCASGCKA